MAELPSPPTPQSSAAKGEVVIRCRGVTKSYDGRPILHGIDLEVRKGETLIIMGGSGHGKSTLLRLLIGAEHPDAGSIELFGQEITNRREEDLYPPSKRALSGVLFQWPGALYNSLTVA
ncbi:MAG: ATP-binding cassette domain-containing protein, partial [Planctomycetes bacterium]|nr:ATP-binding cassette domain-containing protein [Planctomycetota bacterium]